MTIPENPEIGGPTFHDVYQEVEKLMGEPDFEESSEQYEEIPTSGYIKNLAIDPELHAVLPELTSTAQAFIGGDKQRGLTIVLRSGSLFERRMYGFHILAESGEGSYGTPAIRTDRPVISSVPVTKPPKRLMQFKPDKQTDFSRREPVNDQLSAALLKTLFARAAVTPKRIALPPH